jgi:hypothetical protein
VAIVAGAKLLRVEPGLHRLVVAPLPAAPVRVRGMVLPAVTITSPGADGADSVELVCAPGAGNWIGVAGGTIVLRSPPKGGEVLLTVYALPGELMPPLEIELHPIDADSPEAMISVVPETRRPALRAEIILHIEREGDRTFPGEGWAGRVGSGRRIEAIAVRPLEMIALSDIEYKVYASDVRETPWVTGGQLCGTRGQSVPLVGFAVRLVPRLRDDFDVIYSGAFSFSGPGAPVQNGEPCFAPRPGDLLEAIEVRIVKRG